MEFQKPLKAIFLTSSLSLLAACASNAPMQDASTASIPDWVTNPVVENGIADTQCVAAKMDYQFLKSRATSLARAELTKQIDIRVQAMDKTYQRITESKDGVAGGATFESVSKQVAQNNLAGSRAIQSGYVTMPDNSQNFCVMVAMMPEQTRAMFKELIQESGNQGIDPQTESILYEEFRAHKSQQELERETQ